MKYLKFYDLEETYINEKSSLEYYNVSYTQDTEMVWVKEKPNELLMKFNVINNNFNICRDISVFETIQINDDEPIKIEPTEYSVEITPQLFNVDEYSNVQLDYDKFLIDNKTTNVILKVDEPLSDDDAFCYYTSYGSMYYIGEGIEKIDDYTYTPTLDFYDYVREQDNEKLIFFVVKGEYDKNYLDAEGLEYIIKTTNIVETLPTITLPKVLGEYTVRGVLKEDVDYIPSYMFEGGVTMEFGPIDFYCLTEIRIPKNIMYIGEYAFESVVMLKNVLFENGSLLESIGECAFARCSSLESINIPNGVTSIGDGAFEYCRSLSEITIPSGVTSIGGNVFSDCKSLSEITIPSGVTEIDSYLVMGCDSLTSITFEEGSQLTTIGYKAFASRSLESINLPNSLTSISSSAFDSCYSLSSITIPNSVTSIGNNAFENCYSLQSIVIPEGVTSIGEYAFENCYGLNEFICLSTKAPSLRNTFYDIKKNGILYYPQGSNYSSWMSSELYYLGYLNWTSVELQDSYDFKVNFITNGTRVESPYNSLTINGIQGVKQDDNSYLFSGLQPIDVNYKADLVADGNVIDTIDIRYANKWIVVGDNSAMLTCVYNPCLSTQIYSGNNLSYSSAYVDGKYVGKLASSYTFTEISEHIIQYSGVNSIGASAFSYCHSLSEITIPNRVTSIGEYAFYGCGGLKSIELPDNYISIGSYAFNACSLLKTIKIPKTANLDSYSIFSVCYSLKNVHFESDEYYIPIKSTYVNTNVNSVTVKALEPITANDWYFGCNSMYGIYFERVTDIQNDMNIINETTFNLVDGYIEYINDELTLKGCGITFGFIKHYDGIEDEFNPLGLTQQMLNNLIDTTIEYETQNGELKEILLNKNMFNIDSIIENNYHLNNTFRECYSLTSIKLPNGITSIDGAFNRCYSLKSVTIPSSVTSIGYDAFTNCNSLRSITIPSSVTEIGGDAFYYCSLLSSVTFEEGSQLTSIYSRAFYECNPLQSIVIPKNVTLIDESAFFNCFMLTSVTFEEDSQLNIIGRGSFEFCHSINNIVIPEHVEYIDDHAFNYCYPLSKIICLTNKCSYIGNYTFHNVHENGILYHKNGIDFSSWLSDEEYKLGYYNWTSEEIFTPQECTNLVISAENVNGRQTVTTISYTATTNGVNNLSNEYLTNVIITGTAVSAPFEQNTSFIDEVERTITFEYMGITTSTTITQGVLVDRYYSIDLNNQWQLSNVENPDSSLFDGIYESTLSNGKATITIDGYTNFTLYIRSYSYNSGDYMMVGQLDADITNSYYGSSSVKAHTKDAMNYNTSMSAYTKVEFNNIDGGKHTIQIVDRQNIYRDYGCYFFIPNDYVPTICTNLDISAENVIGRKTATTITYTATTSGYMEKNGERVDGNVIITGTTISEPFSKNTDTENEVIRTITFEYMGVTASTTITQGIWVDVHYSIDLNNQWQLSTTIANPDSNTYDGVYESFSNKGVHYSADICTITIDGYNNFKLYVRSNAQTNYDYVVVSNLDCTLSSGTTGGTNVKATTSGKQNSGVDISNYTLVEFDSIDGGTHTIQVMYRKNDSLSYNDDRGYLLIPKEQ